MANVWEVSAEAVAALNKLGDDMLEAQKAITEERNKLIEVYEVCKDGLGPNAAKIKALIDAMEENEQEGTKLVKKLVLRVYKAASHRGHQLQAERYTKKKR